MTLIAYDITDAKRLRKVAKLLENEGLRVQHSVFELKIADRKLKTLVQEIENIIDPKSDKVFIYKISDNEKHNYRRGKSRSIWEMIF